MDLAPDPDFLYIGAAKAGSTWMARILSEHPDVFVPPAKDIQFFSRDFDKGFVWYRSFFKHRGSATSAGELSHDYFLSAEFASRIYGYKPEIKLIACLREPVERAVSRYLYARAYEVPSSITFGDYSFRPEILSEALYGQNLSPFYSLFPRENILVLFYDDLCRDPAEFVRRLYHFLGVDSTFVPPSLFTKVLAARRARLPIFSRAATRGAKILRSMGLAGLVGRIKHNPLFDTLMYDSTNVRIPALTPEMKLRLSDVFAADLDVLRDLLDHPLPPGWPSARGSG